MQRVPIASLRLHFLSSLIEPTVRISRAGLFFQYHPFTHVRPAGRTVRAVKSHGVPQMLVRVARVVRRAYGVRPTQPVEQPVRRPRIDRSVGWTAPAEVDGAARGALGGSVPEPARRRPLRGHDGGYDAPGGECLARLQRAGAGSASGADGANHVNETGFRIRARSG